MMKPLPLPDLPPDTLLRSGTAARLAGLPATTLRVWERRYGVVAAPKTATGQRLYSVPDVRRLALLRQLTRQGHAIGTIAAMPLQALQALVTASAPQASGPGATGPSALALQVVAVGPLVAARLARTPWAARLRVHADLAQARASESATASAAGPMADAPPRHLVVDAPALSPTLAADLAALAHELGAGVSVLYRFGSAAALQLLGAAGIAALREPVPARELARHLDTLAQAAAPVEAPPRRFSDAELARLAALPSKVLCECPRHLAEIVAQLAGFERYSAECRHAHPADAALHRRLHALAADARARFEQALAEVAAAEGISAQPA
jgi:MerR family transcriptional regulator, light-induced transcriptional regulator